MELNQPNLLRLVKGKNSIPDYGAQNRIFETLVFFVATYVPEFILASCRETYLLQG
jgi:hypothetical protein